MDDDKLAIEEARRAGQHGSVKAQVEGEVQAEIAEHAARTAPPQQERVGQVAEQFRAKAVDEVVETEREVERARGVARVSQIVDYIFYVIYGQPEAVPDSFDSSSRLPIRSIDLSEASSPVPARRVVIR